MKTINTKTLLLGQKNTAYAPLSALYATDPDAKLIIDLMREERDALGFIPIPSLLNLIHTHDALIWQRDDHQHKIGYLIHSPPRYMKTIHVYLTVIEIDKRRRKHATRAVAQLIKKAYKANAPEIRLRCADDLQANQFWKSLGFELLAQTNNDTQAQRIINTYTLPRHAFKHIVPELIIPAPALPTQNNPPAEPRGLTRAADAARGAAVG